MRESSLLTLAICASLVFSSPASAGAMFMGLGDLPGGTFVSVANRVSENMVAVGSSNNLAPQPVGEQAFRWTQGSGMVGLGDLPGGWSSSLARDVSADGSVVVGQGQSYSGQEAFRWTEEGGIGFPARRIHFKYGPRLVS
jgi:uncharacterized membrane protein